MCEERATNLPSTGRIRPSVQIVAAGALILFGGCAALERDKVAETESMLTAAGFSLRQPNTPERQMEMASLEPHKILRQPSTDPTAADEVSYVYVDPDSCRCLFVGDDRAYKEYRRLATEQRVAAQRLEAAELNGDAGFDWNGWRSPFW
jgi:hypothetical protein